MKKIPVAEPVIGLREIWFVLRSIRRKQISGYSTESIPIFEKKFASYSNTKYAVAVSNGTTAIHLVLAALGIGRGDEVLVSAYTNMATFFPILQLGATAIPVDIDKHHFNMDPLDLESKITSSTKAIIVVHIFGHPAPMEKICLIAERYNIPIIEDCAEAHGAEIKGKRVGSFGVAGCFSFYANKLMTTGEGGMITTSNLELKENLKSMASLSFGNNNKFLHKRDGYNFRLSNIQAAFGLAQMKRIEKTIRRKQKIAAHYSAALSHDSRLNLPFSEPGVRNVFWMYLVQIRNPDRYQVKKIIEKLHARGIECREGFIPFSDQEHVLRQYSVKPPTTPIASEAGISTFYLPSGPILSKRKINYVCRSLLKVLDEF
jgi:perosamine synthetase